jgi:hypothetical protein
MEEELEVFLNEAAAQRVAGGRDMAAFASEFAGWAPAPAVQTREFLESDIRRLLSLMEKDSSTATVIGFNEFPYTKGGTLQGPDREIEREYWLQLSNVDARYPRSSAASAHNPWPRCVGCPVAGTR